MCSTDGSCSTEIKNLVSCRFKSLTLSISESEIVAKKVSRFIFITDMRLVRSPDRTNSYNFPISDLLNLFLVLDILTKSIIFFDL